MVLWCRGNEAWRGDTREEGSHHRWMSLRRGRGRAFQHAKLLRVATLRKKGEGMRWWEEVFLCVRVSAGFPGGVNWLLTPSLYAKMVGDHHQEEWLFFHTGTLSSPSFSVFIPPFFFLLISHFHFRIDLHLDVSNLCSAKANFTLISANECWILERDSFLGWGKTFFRWKFAMQVVWIVSFGKIGHRVHV